MSTADGGVPGSLSGVRYLSAISARCRARSATASGCAQSTCSILMRLDCAGCLLRRVNPAGLQAGAQPRAWRRGSLKEPQATDPGAGE